MLVKACGARVAADIEACEEAGVDLVGFNFVPSSKRFISVTSAADLRSGLRNAAAVGVFMDQSIAEVRDAVVAVGLDFVQLHGSERPELWSAAEVGAPLIKAMTYEQAADADLVQRWAARCRWLLIDGRAPGSGKTWDVSALRLRDGTLGGVGVLLAGGLSPDNVAAAVAACRPVGVDSASGVELLSGPNAGMRMDPVRVSKFLTEARRVVMAADASGGAR